MSDSYLWSRTGRPDPFVLRLERELAPVRERVQAAGQHTGAVHGFVRVGAIVVGAAAAAMLLAWLAGRTAEAAHSSVAREVPQPVVEPVAVSSPDVLSAPSTDDDLGPAGAMR